jgi:amino acid transporter
VAIIIGCIVWIVLMTWICYRGIELSARIQVLLLGTECLILGIFSVVALVNTYQGLHGSIQPVADWFNPFALSSKALVLGILLGIFIYWGWDSGVAVNEESENPAEGPGRAAVLSTVLLVLIYILVATAAQADAGTHFLAANDNDVLSALGNRVFGAGVLDKLLLFSVLTSASASTQTTILPTARTTISMASWGALPKVFARVHPRFQTPSFSTLMMGGVSIVWTVGLLLTSSPSNILGDSITGLGFAILFYYGFTGLACAIYFRRELFKTWYRLLLVGLVPFAGFGGMAYIFVKNYATVSTPGYNYSPPLLGVQVPIVIGIGGLLVHGRAVGLHARLLQAPPRDRRPPDPRGAPGADHLLIAGPATRRRPRAAGRAAGSERCRRGAWRCCRASAAAADRTRASRSRAGPRRPRTPRAPRRRRRPGPPPRPPRAP